MADAAKLLMLVGAATPPGRLAAAVAAAVEMVRAAGAGVNVDILNLAEVPVDICDGRPLEQYGEPTRQAHPSLYTRRVPRQKRRPHLLPSGT